MNSSIEANRVDPDHCFLSANNGERSGSVVKCLTQYEGVVVLSLTGVAMLCP